MATFVTPKKNTAFEFYVGLVSQANPKIFQVSPTLAAGDVKVSTDNGTSSNMTTLPVIGTNTRVIKVNLSAAEMNGDNVSITFSDAAGAEWCDLVVNIQTSARQIDDLAYPATSGRSMVVDASGLVDANTVKVGPTGSGTAQTARDLGTSVLIASGSGTGQLDVTSGVIKANLAQILGTALTETAGLIAAGFKKFFNVATPTGTVNSLPDAVPDASGGLPVTGTRLTAIPTLPAALVGGRIDASVGAMASGVLTATAIAADAITAAKIADGAIDAATFAAGAINASAIAADAITDAKVASDVTIASVTGNVGGNVTGSVGSVAGAVGSVTGNVGGNVTGSVGSVSASVTLAASAVQAIWDALTSALTTSGSIGKWILDKLDVVLSTRLATLSYTAPDNASSAAAAAAAASAATDASTLVGRLTSARAGYLDKLNNLPEGIKKNTALNNFTFFMVDSSDHASGKTGLTVTATRRLDGGSFAACANAPTEIANGYYTIDFAAADLNGDMVCVRFSATGADDAGFEAKLAA